MNANLVFPFLGGLLLTMAIAASARAPIWVIDGDTIDIRGERIRVANLDAPDVGSHAKCRLEERQGQGAKAYAITVVRGARAVTIADRQGRDRYGRTLARIVVDGNDFASVMIAKGLARPWRGRSSDWCSF